MLRNKPELSSFQTSHGFELFSNGRFFKWILKSCFLSLMRCRKGKMSKSRNSFCLYFMSVKAMCHIFYSSCELGPFFFYLFHSDSLVFSALSYAEWFSPLVTKSKTYISVHCLLLLQEKPPATVSFTSVFEERWSAELLLWRQHVFFHPAEFTLVFRNNI